MTDKASEKNNESDYYLATLDEGSLTMEPYCTCGNHLLEEYFCERCNRECRCTDIRCDDESTFKFVENLIVKDPKFRNFKACKM